MFQIEEIKEFASFIEKDIISSTTPSLKNYKLQKLSSKFQNLYDLTISLTLELPSVKCNPNKNYNSFNFQDDIGKILYAILNKNEKLLLQIINKQDYVIQKWLCIILNKYFLKKFKEDILLAQMENYYKISDLLPYINLPDILENSSVFSIQSLKRNVVDKVTYPFYLIKIPKYTSYKQINYLIKKKDGTVVSNILSGKIRKELLSSITESSFGVIGVLLKQKNYKRKYNFLVTYYSSDYNNVLALYKGKNEFNELEIDTLNNLSLKSELLLKPKLIKIESKDDLIKLLKNSKYNKKFIVLSNQGVDILKLNIKYEYAKILDYIYNEDYEAIGLKITYNDEIYDIYFNVMATNYVEGIEGKYVKIGVSEYNSIILNIFYNAEMKQWSKHHKQCVICKSVKYKHYKNGVCSSCNNKISKLCEELSGNYIEECDAEFDKLYYEDYEVYGDGEYIYFNIMKGRQMKLPLYEVNKLC